MKSLLLLQLIILALSPASAIAIERITVLPNGQGQNGFLAYPHLSADGNLIVFESTEQDFVQPTNHGVRHIYAYDRQAEEFERLSLRTSGLPGSGYAYLGNMSDDGRFVVFEHDSASGLDPADDNGHRDVYIRDRQTDETIWVSQTHDGEAADGDSYAEAISNDGRYVVFKSWATDLVTSPIVNGSIPQLYLRDRTLNTIELISQSSEGTVGNTESFAAVISGDGRYIVFESHASNLLDDGLDTNGETDIFIRDMDASPSPTTTRVSLTNAGAQISGVSRDPDVSADGRYISFQSDASGIVPGVSPAGFNQFQVYVLDTISQTTVHVSRSDSGVIAESRCDEPSISANGRYVVFESKSNAIAPGNSGDLYDIFAHDLQTGKTTRVSVSETGVIANGSSFNARVSDSGLVVFRSNASNFVFGDTEGEQDLFVAPVDAPVAKAQAQGDPNAALRSALLSQIAKLKKKQKAAKKARKIAKVKKFKKKIQVLQKRLLAL